MGKINIVWFRRDLRLSDHHALYLTMESGLPVLPIFIFDNDILDELPANDARFTFIYDLLSEINSKVNNLFWIKDKPLEAWKKIISQFEINQVFTNKDYEPYAIKRDREVRDFLKSKNIEFISVKDQVIFEENDVLKDDGKPYTVYTPFKKKWLKHWEKKPQKPFEINLNKIHWAQHDKAWASIEELGFKRSEIKVNPFQLDHLNGYADKRNTPSINGTSDLSPHLRFGTVGIRELVHKVKHLEVFLSELIWREFFMQILFHFPHVVDGNFRAKYDRIQWRNDKDEFEKWCNGNTGYPIVDAGMRQLNQTGYMHNRVRMITASFLCKHLLIDWRWGEAYFAKKLLDYDLSANNGNWQWSAGTGCDAAPYFRVFNPTAQQEKFDKEMKYVKHWVPEYGTPSYPEPMVIHADARKLAIDTYKKGLEA